MPLYFARWKKPCPINAGQACCRTCFPVRWAEAANAAIKHLRFLYDFYFAEIIKIIFDCTMASARVVCCILFQFIKYFVSLYSLLSNSILSIFWTEQSLLQTMHLIFIFLFFLISSSPYYFFWDLLQFWLLVLKQWINLPTVIL